MTAPDDLVTVQVFTGYDNARREITVAGRPGDDGTAALLAALRETSESALSTAYLDDIARTSSPPLFLCRETDDGIGADFVEVPLHTTFADLRLMVGPEPFANRVQTARFGGDGGEVVLTWLVEELAPMGRELAEMFGYAELARRMGSALRRHRHREARRAAESWLIDGGAFPEALRVDIERRDYWPLSFLRANFDLGPRDARAVMDELGYRWDADNRSFYRPMHIDAVN